MDTLSIIASIADQFSLNPCSSSDLVRNIYWILYYVLLNHFNVIWCFRLKTCFNYNISFLLIKKRNKSLCLKANADINRLVAKYIFKSCLFLITKLPYDCGSDNLKKSPSVTKFLCSVIDGKYMIFYPILSLINSKCHIFYWSSHCTTRDKKNEKKTETFGFSNR